MFTYYAQRLALKGCTCNEIEHDLRIAWRRMLQERTWPPLDILLAGGTVVRNHLVGCEYCREHLENAEDWQVADNILSGICTDDAAQEVSPGTIARINQSGAPNGSTYNKHGWHNLPLVYVLPVATSEEGLCRAVIVHDSEELAGPGDIELEGAWRGFYAEMWNDLPVFAEDLMPLGEVSDGFNHQISYETNSVSHPDEGSIAWCFRQFEINLASFFAKAAIAKAITKSPRMICEGSPVTCISR